MILIQELTSLDSEIAQLSALIEAKRQQQEVLASAENLASEALARLTQALFKIEEVAPNAIASLKTAVLELFTDGDGGNDGGGNQPTDPTPDDPTPGADDDEPELIAFNGETGDYLLSDGSTSFEDETPPLTYAQAIKNRCSACWGYEVTTKRDIKEGFVNRTNLNFMEAVNLERTGREFYETVESYLDRLYYNGQSCDLASLFASPVCFDETKYPEVLSPGSRFWHGATWSTGTVIEPLGDDKYRCQIDGAVGEVELSRQSLHYISSSLEGQFCDIDAAPLTGQHCTISPAALENENKSTTDGEAMPYMQLVKVTDNLAYQRKHDGEILCCYIGFRTKAIAQSWLHFFEATTSKVELRLAKRLEHKWEIKLKGLSIKQIERYAKECDFTSSYRTEVASAMPPSYKKPEPPQPVNPDQLEPGDIVTPLLTPGDSYEILQVMPNGILDCKSLRTGVQMGLRPTAVSLVQKGRSEENFVQTNGNYVGLSRQVQQHWEKAGVDPQELIAEMRAKRPPQPAWDANKYNPVLQALRNDPDFAEEF